MTPAFVDPSRSRGLVIAYGVGFALAASLSLILAQRTNLLVFAALAALSAWSAVVAGANLLPSLPFRLRGVLRLLAALVVIMIPTWFNLVRPTVFTGATTTLLQLAGVALAIVAFGFHFLATYGAHVSRETPTPLLQTLVPLARLAAAAHALVLSAVLLWLYAQRSWLGPLEMIFHFVVAALLVETLLHAVARLYQPVRLRDQEAVFGRSVFLAMLFGESGPLRSLAATAEKTLGLKLADTWLVQLGRRLIAPLVLLGILGLWLSTAVTQIPVDSRGVHVESGRFAELSLPPGLHLHAPWPLAAVRVVSTERVQEIALGFERDLAGPVLWAEKHFEGEQNLLVGAGEELLTINVPLQYRVRDAVAYLRRTTDPCVALEALGYRELLALTTAHTAFGLMTTDRVEITEKLRTNLQAASDRLGLGLEIVFVGLKDVHPPVPVAPAYQDVISAEEQQLALADQARSYAVQASAAAQVSATQLRLRATSAAAERVARATGESARFLAPLAAYRAQPDVFMTRRRLETLEASLAEVRQLILLPRAVRTRAHFYLGVDSSSPLSPLTR